jgi:hypothetical protein
MKQNKEIDLLITKLGKEEIINYLNNNSVKPFEYIDIKTFMDACKKLNISPIDDLNLLKNLSINNKSIIAQYKLSIIYEAINNGWVPDFTNSNQYKYYPYFKVLSSGLDYSYSFYVYDYTYTTVGVRLCTDTAAKAEYIGKQFKDFYEDYLL